VLRDMLSMARRATRPGLVVESPYRWRYEVYLPVEDWQADSEAFTAALSAAEGAAKPPAHGPRMALPPPHGYR
jgi:hypothetical protein